VAAARQKRGLDTEGPNLGAHHLAPTHTFVLAAPPPGCSEHLVYCLVEWARLTVFGFTAPVAKPPRENGNFAPIRCSAVEIRLLEIAPPKFSPATYTWDGKPVARIFWPNPEKGGACWGRRENSEYR